MFDIPSDVAIGDRVPLRSLIISSDTQAALGRKTHWHDPIVWEKGLPNVSFNRKPYEFSGPSYQPHLEFRYLQKRFARRSLNLPLAHSKLVEKLERELLEAVF